MPGHVRLPLPRPELAPSKVQALLVARRLGVEQLADRAELSRGLVKEALRGSRTLSVASLGALARALDADLAEITE